MLGFSLTGVDTTILQTYSIHVSLCRFKQIDKIVQVPDSVTLHLSYNYLFKCIILLPIIFISLSTQKRRSKARSWSYKLQLLPG